MRLLIVDEENPELVFLDMHVPDAQVAQLMEETLLKWKAAKKGSSRKLPIELEDRTVYLHPSEIVYISKKKEDKKVYVITNEHIYESHATLVELEEKLAEYNMQRIHKSILVNINHIKEIQPFFNSTYHVYVEGMKEPLPVSRHYIKRLRERLEI